MALATTAVTRSNGAAVNHVTSGAAIVVSAFSVAGDIANAFLNADGYLFCDVAVVVTKNAAGTANLPIILYGRPLNFVGTNDQPIPSANFRSDQLGVRLVENTAVAQSLLFRNIDIGGRAYEFYLENLTGQQINAAWTLTITPWTLIPSP